MARIPAEWEPQSAIMLTWPHADTDWAAQFDAVETWYAQLCKKIVVFEKVFIVCRDEYHQRQIGARLAAVDVPAAALAFALADSNDSWTRDHGPICCVDNPGIRMLDFRFDGWGNKFAAELDDQITSKLHHQVFFPGIDLIRSALVLEGGALETDGAGTLLATRSSVLCDTRNPGWGQGRIEKELRHLLGIDRFLWLDNGQLAGDDTDGHIDTLARFTDFDTICHVACNDPGYIDFEPLMLLRQELRTFVTRQGRPYRLVALPCPAPRFDEERRQLPATYANFLVINHAVLVPVYGDAADEPACQIIRQLFPQRQVIPIECSLLIHQNGSLHCVSMQLPAGLPI